jgi:hypothetical protein
VQTKPNRNACYGWVRRWVCTQYMFCIPMLLLSHCILLINDQQQQEAAVTNSRVTHLLRSGMTSATTCVDAAALYQNMHTDDVTGYFHAAALSLYTVDC